MVVRRVLLVYDEERFVRNHWFAETLTEKLARRGLNLELKLTKELKNEDFSSVTAVIMRCIAPKLSARWEARGIRVFNSAQVAEICNNKLQTIRFFAAHGVPVPESYSLDAEGMYVNLLPFPLVLKSLDGHGGSEVFLVNHSTQIQKITNTIPGKKWLIQRFCNEPGRDVRVYVIGNQIVVAMERKSDSDFRSNYSLGGSARVHVLTREERALVQKVMDFMQFDFAGIDLIYDSGHPILNEIEDVVGCRMVYAQTQIDILERFTEYLIQEIHQ